MEILIIIGIVVLGLAVLGPIVERHEKSTSQQRLLTATGSGTAADIKKALSLGAKPGLRDQSGLTPLDVAAKKSSDPTVIAALIEGGADPEARDDKGVTPLHRAINWKSNPDVVSALLAGGTDPCARDDNGRSPLDIAVDDASFDTKVFGALIKSSRRDWASLFRAVVQRKHINRFAIEALINERHLGMTPLCYAMRSGAGPAAITALLECGADPNARNAHWEDEDGHWEDEGGQTPLHLAGRKGADPAVVAALLEAGAKPNARDRDGDSPVDLAFRKEASSEIRTALLDAALIDCSRNSDETGMTPPLHLAARYGDPEMVKALLNEGSDVNVRDVKGQTPLYCSASNTDLRIMTQLLGAGADPNVRDVDGVAPLHMASARGDLEMINVLLEAGSEVNSRGEFYLPAFPDLAALTPLGAAAVFSRETAAVKALIDAGADPNARDEYGMTPLHRAAKYAGPDVIVTLLDGGADPSARTKKGNEEYARGATPFDMAEDNEALRGTDVYLLLRDARFERSPAPVRRSKIEGQLSVRRSGRGNRDLPSADDFRAEIAERFYRAEEEGAFYIDIKAGGLHRKMGGYPGPNHRVSSLCDIMIWEMRDDDTIVWGQHLKRLRGVSLTIRYRLPG